MLFARAAIFALPFALLHAPAAFALTAEGVWADLQEALRNEKVAVTATTRREGDRLVLTDIVIPVGSSSERVDLRLERIDLQDRADGSVAVILPPEFLIRIDPRDDDNGRDLAVLKTSAPGFSLVIAGTELTPDIKLSAPSIVISVDRLRPTLPTEDQIDLNVAVADLSFQHKMDLAAANKTIFSSLRLGTLHADTLFDAGSLEELAVSFSLDLSKVAVNIEAFLPSLITEERFRRELDGDNPLPVLRRVLGDGLSMRGDVSYDSVLLLTDIGFPGEQGAIKLESVAGKANSRLDAEAAGYEISFGKTELSATGNLPNFEYQNFTMRFAELVYGVSFGIGDLISPQEARLKARLIDLTLPPEILAEADPTGIVGLEPLSYAVELSARYALGAEMLEPGWQPDPQEFPPLDVVDITLNELLLKAAGVTIGGSGSLAFDESDLVTFEGLPTPEGKVSFKATGVNGLMDRILKAGQISPDELMGFRMGLMMFAKVGDTADSLVSVIEFRDKSMYLNGVKLR
jgi:hypothetical protein